MLKNPCLRCGACCAHFRVGFYWAEADDAVGGSVPAAMTVQVTPLQRAMRGTDTRTPRCCALQGEIGQSVVCDIYSFRASTCRDFSASWENNQSNERCDTARRKWGLPPLQPDDFCDDTLVA